MDKNTFNHDKFNTWEKCRKRYYFKYIKELRWVETENNYRLGKNVHALIDYYLRGLNIDHIVKNLDAETKKHWEALKNHPLIKNELIITEWAFNSRIGKTHYWLNGRIDAVFYSKNNYIIADWKTGQNIPENPESSFQSMLYLYSFFNARQDLKLDLSWNDLMFMYVKTPDNENIEPIYYSEEKEQEYEKIFLQKISEIESETDFQRTVPCPVKNCQYKKLCQTSTLLS